MIYAFKNDEPIIPENGMHWIADNSAVIGKVELGEKVSIWFGAVLRGDNELIFVGDGTNIQENSILHTDIGYPLHIGNNCTIGHGAIIHGARIEDNSLIGMGTTILNGAIIRENSLVGAGALITEGKEYPPNSLIVGRPAKVVRELTPDEISDIRKSAIKYQETGLNFNSYCKKL